MRGPLPGGRHDAMPFVAVDIGDDAADRLERAAGGRVLAAFERSLHVALDTGIVVLGVESLGRGPLHLLLRARDWGAFGDVARGARVRTGGAVLHVERIAVGFAGATRYRPPPPLAVADRETLRANRAVLATLDAPPADGFAWRLRAATAAVRGVDSRQPGHERRWAFDTVTAPGLAALDVWLAEALGSPGGGAAPVRSMAGANVGAGAGAGVDVDTSAGAGAGECDAIGRLLGAGPGLTPAGDDLLAGSLLTLHRLRRTAPAAALWNALSPLVPLRTPPPSAALLELAARGRCAASVAALLDALLAAPVTDAARLRARIDRIGATSGWDLCAGIAAVVDAVVATGCPGGGVQSADRAWSVSDGSRG